MDRIEIHRRRSGDVVNQLRHRANIIEKSVANGSFSDKEEKIVKRLDEVLAEVCGYKGNEVSKDGY